MEKLNRKPFMGVTNIIRFNWHFYIAALVIITALSAISLYAAIFVMLLITVSLVISFIIYDRSEVYTLKWLQHECISGSPARIANIHAGFDEFSPLLRARFPNAELTVLDFYDPQKHTEVSIKRARKMYQPFPGTQKVETHALPLESESVDISFVLFSAHEIRDRDERIRFLNGLREKITGNGMIILLEHLRDIPNFLAYNIGFLHFYSRREWLLNFEQSGPWHIREKKMTPFLSIFILQKHGNPS